MKSSFSFCLLVLSATIGSNASADLSAGFDVAPRFEYEEPHRMREEGALGGAHIRYQSQSQLPTWNLDLSLLTGESDYYGRSWSGERATASSDDFVSELTFRMVVNEAASVAPHLGLGLRYWFQDLHDGATSSGRPLAGYRREIVYVYFPVGLTLSRQLSSDWRWQLRGEHRLLQQGRVTSHLSDVRADYEDADNRQKRGYGGEFSMRFTKKSVGLVVEPYYQYWQIEDSDVASVTLGTAEYNVMEPANETSLTGVRLLINF